ncbi:MAG: hypothetical protein Fur0019_09880 [Tibeticola sp.]
MKSNLSRCLVSALAAAAALSLTACGGGSDAPSASAPGNQPVMDVPAPTYAPDSPEMVAYTLLNEERSRCGFGRLAQNTKLDYAAKMHGLYLQANQVVTHDEDPTRPAFYAATPTERATKAGYRDGAAEVIGPAQTPQIAVRSLLAAPGHAAAALDTAITNDVGMAFTSNAAQSFGALVVVLGTPSGPPTVLSGIRTYPCEGTSGVLARSFGEKPSPFPGQVWGQPVYVAGTEKLKVSSAAITGPLGDVPLIGIIRIGRPGVGFYAIAPSVLSPATVYTATIKGDDEGVPFERTIRFQTGPQ